MSTSNGLTRRALLGAALPTLVLGSGAGHAAESRVAIADMHSHFGMLHRPGMPSSDFAEALRSQRVALMAWSQPSDLRWTRAVATGIEQSAEPAAGELPVYFRNRLIRMKAQVLRSGLRLVQTAADVDACLAGDAGVVLASEGADFLEGRVEDLRAFHAQGLRHLQLVHYIRNPIGDFQTVPPLHRGLSDAGKQLVQACNAQGILVDLAHCAWPAVEQALALASKPVIWSHGWVDRIEGHWQDRYGFLQRRLSRAQAKTLADRGGVVGLWGLALTRPGPSQTPGQGNWTVARGDTQAYARELAHLVNWLGADHVGIGSDIEGVGLAWSVDNYVHLRSVIDALAELKLPASSIEKLACGNYARVLKAALNV